MLEHDKALLKHQNLLGLIGFPLSHSFSKRYFAEKFSAEGIANYFYELFPIASVEEMPLLWEQYPNLKGINVTIPYKEQVIPYLCRIDGAAAAIRAVNTIKKEEDGLVGYNTDVYGFEYSLKNKLDKEKLEIKRAIILGTGGAAKACAYVLQKLGVHFQYVSRKSAEDQLTYEQLRPEIIQQLQLIINTTPLGMSPQLDTFPKIPYEALSKQHLLFDLVYNPAETAFLRKGKEQGTHILNGLEMLQLQAEKAWQIWTNSSNVS